MSSKYYTHEQLLFWFLITLNRLKMHDRRKIAEDDLYCVHERYASLWAIKVK